MELWHDAAMGQLVCPLVSAADRACLEAIVADRNCAQKHVARVRIILHSAERLPVSEVAKRAGIGRPAVWRWQRRFAEAGVDALLRDASRKPGKAPVPAAVVQRLIALTCAEPPSKATALEQPGDRRGNGAVLAHGAAHLKAHDLRAFPPPHLQAPPSSDSCEAQDVVSFSVAPPHHAIISISQQEEPFSELDRTQPGYPLRAEQDQDHDHDYIRHGTHPALFAR